MNVGSSSIDHPPALQAGFYCGYYGSSRGIASLVRSKSDVLGYPSHLAPNWNANPRQLNSRQAGP